MHEILSEDWTTVAILAIPHFLYAFIWYFPHLWMKAFGKHSIQCFESIAWILKGMSPRQYGRVVVALDQFPLDTCTDVEDTSLSTFHSLICVASYRIYSM